MKLAVFISMLMTMNSSIFFGYSLQTEPVITAEKYIEYKKNSGDKVEIFKWSNQMDTKKYRYNHIGIPTDKKLKNETYLPDYDVYISGYEENEFNIEWMRYGEKCTVPEIVKKLPHVAFEVDDINEALKDQEVIIEPNSPSEGVIVAFILVNDAPIELMQFIKKK